MKSLILQIKADIQAFPMIYLSFFNFENPLSCIKFSNVSKKRVFLIGTVPHCVGMGFSRFEWQSHKRRKTNFPTIGIAVVEKKNLQDWPLLFSLHAFCSSCLNSSASSIQNLPPKNICSWFVCWKPELWKVWQKIFPQRHTAIIIINRQLATVWSKMAIFREVWRNINMQPRPWASQALIPHSWAFQKGI